MKFLFDCFFLFSVKEKGRHQLTVRMKKEVLELGERERHETVLQRCGKRCCGQHQRPLAVTREFKGEWLSLCLFLIPATVSWHARLD